MITVNYTEKVSITPRRCNEEFDGKCRHRYEESFGEIIKDSLGLEAGTGSGSTPSSAS